MVYEPCLHDVIGTSLRRHAANIITVGRICLLFVAAGFSVSGIFELEVLAIPVAVVALVMDWLDGVAARKWGSASKVGGVLDIAGDRLVENVWWVTFAWLRIVPLWVPVVVLSRGFLTDAIRSYALSRGQTAFGKETMMESSIGHLLVASRASRGIYCGAKVVAFTLLFTLNVAQAADPGGAVVLGIHWTAMAATYLTVALCLVRGMPVLIESRRFLV